MPSSNTKLSTPTHYKPNPTSPPPPLPQPPQYVIVLPYSPNPPCTFTLVYNSCRRYLLFLSAIFFLSAAVFFLYPSDPDVSIIHLHVSRLKIHSLPKIFLDITLDSTVKLFNKDFYSIDYNYVIVSVGYGGKQLGYVTSDHVHVKARASSYINATLQLDGVEVFADVIPLIEDLAKGSILFDTVTEIGGRLSLALLEIPLKKKLESNMGWIIW